MSGVSATSPLGLRLLGAALLLVSACGQPRETPATANDADRKSGRTETVPSAARGEEDKTTAGGRGRSEGAGRPGDGRRRSEGKRGGEGAEKQTTVAVVDTAFDPSRISISRGAEVVWKQTGGLPHSVTASDESFDSHPDCSPISVDDCTAEGDTFSFTFEEAGSYDYYCRVHGLPNGTGMSGTVVVQG